MASAKQNPVRVTIAAGLGNVMELYDFALYAMMLPIISPLFFKAETHTASVLLGMASFAISFIIGPFASLVWGWFGDRYGRKKMLQYAMFFMGVPTIGIGLLPTYDSIGILAPITLVFFRMMQGVSTSGEIKGSKIFAMEHNGDSNLGKTSGSISAFGALGVLIASIVTAVLNKEGMHKEAWRIAFICGGLILFIAFYIRKTISESAEYLKEEKSNIKLFSVFDVILQNKKQSIIVFTLGAFLGVLSYFVQVFMPNFFATIKHLPIKTCMLLTTIAMVSVIFSGVISGIFIDKYGSNFFMKLTLLACGLLAVPTFSLTLSDEMNKMIIAQMIFGVLVGMNAASCTVVMYKLFKTNERLRGVNFAYVVGVSSIGGVTPLILMRLVHNSVNHIICAYYVAFYALLALLILYSVSKRIYKTQNV